MKTLTDIRGVEINIGNTVGVSYFNYDKNKPAIEVDVVEAINYTQNVIYLQDGEPIELELFDVIVLPDEYKEW